MFNVSTDLAALFAGLATADKQVILRNPRLKNQPLKKILAKAGWVSDRQPDIFIEVKHLDSLPVDVFCLGQRIQKIQLGRSRCHDNTGPSAIEDGSAHSSRRLFSSSSCKRHLVFNHSHD